LLAVSVFCTSAVCVLLFLLYAARASEVAELYADSTRSTPIVSGRKIGWLVGEWLPPLSRCRCIKLLAVSKMLLVVVSTCFNMFQNIDHV